MPRAVLSIEVSKLNTDQQEAADRAVRFTQLRMSVPQVLNFPVCIVQVPFMLVSPGKREWIPNGMMKDIWRDISWPLAGILFWWIIGRTVEALISGRRGIIWPRVRLAETIFAALFVCMGIAMLAGLVTSTPDDRRDLQFVALMVGGMLWGILAGITITARVLQWKIRKKEALVSA